MTSSTETDPLAALSGAGVSIWLDDLSRELLAGGGLKRLITDKHVVGVTTNPTIFASALAQGDRYTEQLQGLAAEGVSVSDAVFTLTTDDVRDGCRAFQEVHAGNPADGRVSIEVDPGVARDADATVLQAIDLWETVNEPNLFVKIPATREGLTAITAVVARGISVNVTLIFSLERYRAVMDAYQTGLEHARTAGHDLSEIHSVASFFVSRVDTEVDHRLDELGTAEATRLKGKAAVANARLAHAAFEEMVAQPRWQTLAAAGARPQRPLWASTGVKDPSYPDTLYVGELAIAGTVDTMPGSTLEAFADHGTLTGARPTPGVYAEAAAHLRALGDVGVDFEDVTDTLEREGLSKFVKSWDELGATVEREMHSASARKADGAAAEDAELLAIYLNDHLAGATGGVELFRRAASAHQAGANGALTELAGDVEEDHDALTRIMTDLGISIDRSKVAMAWLSEKAGRLKPNGRLVSRSPLSDVLETEAMLMGVHGKAAAWHTLRARSQTDPRLDTDRLDALIERAEKQIDTVRHLHAQAVARVFPARS
ncbi:transaldolase [Streptomyces sp. NPDC055056]